MPNDSTIIIIHSKPHGKLFKSACESSQYRSQVKYQQTALFSSSINKLLNIF